MTLLEVDGLDAGYGRARVLHGVELSVGEGEAVAVLGANGAGKTTLLRALSGLIERSGSVKLAGRELTRTAPDAIAALGVGHVPEGRGTFPRLTVRENLLLGAHRRRDRGAVVEDLARWTAFFPVLEARQAQAAGSMSGGEQQMLAIARALMGRPRLLLLDEPSAGLAPAIVDAVFDALREINEREGTTMLVVEQNVAAVSRLAARGAALANGVVEAAGPLDELIDAGAVRRAYLGA